MIVLILSRHSSLCGFVAFPCDASAAHPGKPPVCVTECHTNLPSSSIPTQCLSRQTFPSHNPILGNAQNCSCSIMMTNEDSLRHAACKRTDTVFSNFTKPNFLSKLRHGLSPSSTSSPHFTCLSVFANSHLVHDLHCKTRKPTEQRTVICDTHTCVLFSGNSKNSTLSFNFLAAISTRPLAIPAESPPRLHIYMNQRILECFRTRFIVAFQNDCAKTNVVDEHHRK